MSEEQAIANLRRLVEKHCYCDTRWPATARIDDNHAREMLAEIANSVAIPMFEQELRDTLDARAMDGWSGDATAIGVDDAIDAIRPFLAPPKGHQP